MITVTRKAQFNCSAEQLFRIITNNKEYGWRSDLKRIDVIKGGNSFIEYTKKGVPTLFTITSRIPYNKYEFKLQNNNLTGKWTGELHDTEAGSEMELTESIHVKSKLLSLFAPYFLKRQQETYIKDLTKIAVKE